MAIEGNHLGMPLLISDLDGENRAYFTYCAAHDFHLQACPSCKLLRYPPTTACPWCGTPGGDWTRVEGKGTVHSYTEIHHAIQPAFRTQVPYQVLLVELDTQRGTPTEYEALRVMGNLVTQDGKLAGPELVKQVGIGSRMRMVFSDVGQGMSLPQWTLDETAEQPATPWRYPQE
jgi:uncharacterized OB-fold protein